MPAAVEDTKYVDQACRLIEAECVVWKANHGESAHHPHLGRAENFLKKPSSSESATHLGWLSWPDFGRQERAN